MNKILLIISIVEFVAIVFLLILWSNEKYKHSEKYKLKRKMEEEKEKPEFDKNIIDSIFNAKKVYDKLKKVCHPDLFATDEDKYAKADKLFQEITKNKYNYDKLMDLKQQAEQELNITINLEEK